jgi:hypothetical protein
MNLVMEAKKVGKRVLRPMLYRFPPVFLSPGGLHLWFEALEATKNVPGDVVELGCYLGGTCAMGARFLEEIRSERRYIAIDTFGGFTDDQFKSELDHGGDPGLRHHFSANTPELARWVMDRHGAAKVKMIQGDIAALPDEQLPKRISACLIDIDLAEPIYVALNRLYPRLSPGGIIIVDDCDSYTAYKAAIGYERFVSEQGLPHKIRLGKGVVVKQPEEPRRAAAAGRVAAAS